MKIMNHLTGCTENTGFYHIIPGVAYGKGSFVAAKEGGGYRILRKHHAIAEAQIIADRTGLMVTVREAFVCYWKHRPHYEYVVSPSKDRFSISQHLVEEVEDRNYDVLFATGELVAIRRIPRVRTTVTVHYENGESKVAQGVNPGPLWIIMDYDALTTAITAICINRELVKRNPVDWAMVNFKDMTAA